MTARPDLAPIAARELALRERDWPKAVAAGAMTQDQADADLAAWRAIAELLEHGQVETSLTWAELTAALLTAQDRRIEAVIAAKGSDKEARLEARLGGVVACRRAVERSAWRYGYFLKDLAA